MEKYKEKVYFIGAGPGDPELISREIGRASCRERV